MYSSPYLGTNASQSVHSERLINSTILREEILGNQNLQDQIKYVEVPVIEEVVRHVPKKEFIEVEKKVPRYEYEWVERVVEIPQVQVVEKYVDVPQVQEIIRHVPIKQYVDVPKEVFKYVPKIETKIVEKEVEVPGEVIEIPKPYIIENKIIVPKYVDQEVASVVAQRLQPVVSESETDFIDVEMKEYNPYLVAVDVYVPRPVNRQLTAHSRTEVHHVVDVPVAQFNALLKTANPGLNDADLEGKLMIINGVAPIAVGPGCQHLVNPVSDEWKSEHVTGQTHVSHVSTYSTTGGSYLSTTGPSYMSTTTTTQYPASNYQTTTSYPTTVGTTSYSPHSTLRGQTTTYSSAAQTYESNVQRVHAIRV